MISGELRFDWSDDGFWFEINSGAFEVNWDEHTGAYNGVMKGVLKSE